MKEGNNKLYSYDLLNYDNTPNGRIYFFWCPGCKEKHTYNVGNTDGKPTWSFNGNYDCPTFTPSLLYPTKPVRCHLFVKNGKIEFCGDCGHELKNQTVDMVELPDQERF